jgi:hypothetical protein
MLAESASVELQERVLGLPYTMLPGAAEISTVGRGISTMTVTLSVAVPPGPVAVMV